MNCYLAILFWFHLMGISIWVGGSILLPLVIAPALEALDPAARGKFMEAWSRKFTPWVAIAILVVVVTGILLTGRMFGFAYLLGVNVLVIKIIVAVLMIANGFYAGIVLSRKVMALAPKGTPPSPEFLKAQRLLAMHSWIQAGLSVIVLLLAGLLTAG